MAKSKKDAKVYRIVQNEGKITFRVEELWEGGVQRGPYGSQDAATNAEETVARDGGFIDDLSLEGITAEEKSPLEAFKKDDDGTWLCLEGCSIDINDKEVVFTQGQSFAKGDPFMGIDVAEWLDEKAEYGNSTNPAGS